MGILRADRHRDSPEWETSRVCFESETGGSGSGLSERMRVVGQRKEQVGEAHDRWVRIGESGVASAALVSRQVRLPLLMGRKEPAAGSHTMTAVGVQEMQGME